MEDTRIKYFNHGNFVSMLESMRNVEEYLTASYRRLQEVQDMMQADDVWKNMGKEESVGFLSIIVQMHRDLSDINDAKGAVPNMIQSLEEYLSNMENFYMDSSAYKRMLNHTTSEERGSGKRRN